MTREEFRKWLLQQCGDCKETAFCCSLVKDTYSKEAFENGWKCKIEKLWNYYLATGKTAKYSRYSK